MNYNDISIKLNGIKLIPVDYVKYLGMYIDKYLSWNYHVLQLNKKLSRANGIISKLRHYASIEICLQVYYAIFYSHLIYGCNIWGLTSEENLKKVEVLQKKCIRIMTFSDFTSHTNPLFINLKILKVREVIKLQQFQLLYKFLNNSLPTDLEKLFTLNSCTHSHQTRQLFHIPRINTSTYGEKSIKYACPKLWHDIFKYNKIAIDNDVNNTINFDQIRSIYQFKRVLKKHFFYCYSLQ